MKGLELFVDACFTLDIILTFYKLDSTQKEIDFPIYRKKYLLSSFIFDCFAAIPGLVTLENSEYGLNFVKLLRFIHWNRFFDQINMITEKVLMGWLGYTRQKVSEYVDFVKLEIAVVLLTHMMACMWIHIGR